ncbi:hypothetical protein D039_4192B, partial [Vibrio parahaemolyticus EKP-028]
PTILHCGKTQDGAVLNNATFTLSTHSG